MCRKISSVAWLMVPVVAAFLVGCPMEPVLEVSPTAVSLNGSTPSALVVLSNAGAGSLTWAVGACPAWIAPSVNAGTITDQTQALRLTSVTTGLAAGTYTGVVVFTSNGGDRSVAVVLTVVAPPTLEVTPGALNFGASETLRTLVVRNAGSGTLTWAIPAGMPAGYTISKTSGSLASGSSETLTVTLNRASLSPGTNEASFAFTSNGGGLTVTLTATVQALQVTPLDLDFGAQIEELTLTLRNTGVTALNWTINNAALPAWLEVSAAAGTLAAGATEDVVCTADRTGLDPGATTGEFTVASTGGSETVSVSIEGPDPVLFATPLTLDFGSTGNNKAVTIQNIGTGTLAWSIEEGMLDGGTWTAGDKPWLATAPSSGNISASGATVVNVNVDRSQSPPDPVNAHLAWLRIYSADGGELFVAISQLTLPPTLRVLPESVQLGTTFLKKQLAIWNGGLGTLYWRIDTTGRPAWATVTPVDGEGIASGDVGGSETDAVTISADRTGLPPADEDYAWEFEVTAEDGEGTPVESRTVRVTMNIARTATIVVDTGENNEGKPNIDDDDVYFVPFGTSEDTMPFTISNLGTAPLVWSIDGAGFPAWLTSVSPMQATLQPGQSVVVTVTIDRKGVNDGDDYMIEIDSNDPVTPVFPIRIEFQVPELIIIGVTPSVIDLGTYGISTSFAVANLGDPGSLLNFEVTSNKPWAYFYPETGTSEGTSDIVKNWSDVNVSVDRAQLDGTGGTAEFRIRAFETDDLGRRVYSTIIPEQKVKIVVQAAPLSFEAAWARTRIPSLVRYVLLMRDITYRPIALPFEDLGEMVNGFSIFENDVPVEMLETNKFLTSAENLRTNIVILLDYSGSMFAAAGKVADETISGAADPLQALYNRCVAELIDELPPHYSVALMEFHDRGQPSRRITAPDLGPTFTNDKALLHARLEAISIPDHGATELLPAVLDAAGTLLDKDNGDLRVSFDDTDVRGIICLSDGRLTTPPGKIKDVIDLLWPVRVRFFGLGWGDSILHEPLARLAAGTGGHYYPTAKVPSGELDGHGNPILLPSVDTMLDWCLTDDPAVDACDQSIAKDLRSQVVFSYATLNESQPVRLRLSAAFDNPNDGEGTCLADQKTISGSLTQKEFDFISIVGDNRLGQISMRSDGIDGELARVVIRAEYMPRNVSSFQFRIQATEDFDVYQVPAVFEGLVEDWNLTVEGDVYTLVGPGPLPYAAYGDLLYIDFSELATDTLAVSLDVLDPLWSTNPFSKYFTYPDSITVGEEEVLAPAFPTPKLNVESLEFGTAATNIDVTLRNIGGSHAETEVWLDWVATPGSANVTVTPQTGRLISTMEADVLHIGFNRNVAPGEYDDKVTLDCTCGTLGLGYLIEIPVTITVLEPVLLVWSPDFTLPGNLLDFGTTDTSLEFNVQNAGQSVLEWSIDRTGFPDWLDVSPSGGERPTGTQQTVLVSVDRSGLVPGGYAHTFTVDSTYGQETITVEMVVPI